MTFLALVGAAGFRTVPGVLMEPLRTVLGWSVTWQFGGVLRLGAGVLSLAVRREPVPSR